MKTVIAALVCLASTAVSAMDRAWSPVAVSDSVEMTDKLWIPSEPSEECVCYVGRPAPREESGPRAVEAFDGAVYLEGKSAEAVRPAAKPGRVIDPSAIWPDADGEIIPPSALGRLKAPSLRNPWQPPEAAGKVSDGLLRYGGLIRGEAGLGVALINGRIFKPGDLVEGLVLRTMTPQEALMEADGQLYVIPRGRLITVRRNKP